MSFHDCGGNVGDDVHIPLPHWVTEIGQKNHDIYFTNKEGKHNTEFLTWGIDKGRVLRGRTAVESKNGGLAAWEPAGAAEWLEVSSSTNETLDAVRRAQDSVKSENITISSANASNPGIPPSSLMTFLRKNSLTSGVVLEDFDNVFTNKFYHSHLDDLSNINSSSIAAAASLVARALYILASDTKNLSSSALTSINVNASLVEELVGCLVDCEPGLSCDLVKSYISPANTCPSHYVGVILDEPSSTPDLEYVGDISRFVWNFLAERTSIPKENASSVCTQDCSNDGEVCIRAETEGKGVCVVSTTRYVPAYSTRLKFESGGTWTVLPPNNSDPMGLLDAVWTESNWDVIGLRVYTVQNSSFDRLVLLGSIAVTVLAYFAIVIFKGCVTKALKRD